MNLQLLLDYFLFSINFLDADIAFAFPEMKTLDSALAANSSHLDNIPSTKHDSSGHHFKMPASLVQLHLSSKYEHCITL